MKPATAASATLILMRAAFPAQAEPTVEDEEDIEVVTDAVRFDFLNNTAVIELTIYTGRDQSSWLNLPSTTPPVVLYSRGQFVGSCSVGAGDPLCSTNPTNIPCPFPAGARRYPATCSADLDFVADPPSLLTDPRSSADEGAALSANIDVALTPGDGVPRVFLTEFEGSQARTLRGKQLSDYLDAVGSCNMDDPILTITCTWERGSTLDSAPTCLHPGVYTREQPSDAKMREIWLSQDGRPRCTNIFQ